MILCLNPCLHYLKVLSFDWATIHSSNTKYSSHFLGMGPDTVLRALHVSFELPNILLRKTVTAPILQRGYLRLHEVNELLKVTQWWSRASSLHIWFQNQ